MNELSHPTVRSVQVLRAIAALAVVYFHCTAPRGGFGLPQTGKWGVDIFFIISGFIIARVASQDATRFLRKRLIRILPLYVLATVLAAGVAVFFARLINSTEVSAQNLLFSLLFVPFQMSARNGPILEVGWTLSYEMFFYLVVGLCLLLATHIKVKISRSALGILIAAIILILIPISGWIIPAEVYAVHFFQNTLLYEFLMGVGIYFIWVHVNRAQSRHCDMKYSNATRAKESVNARVGGDLCYCNHLGVCSYGRLRPNCST